jgi:hypothetical protein
MNLASKKLRKSALSRSESAQGHKDRKTLPPKMSFQELLLMMLNIMPNCKGKIYIRLRFIITNQAKRVNLELKGNKWSGSIRLMLLQQGSSGSSQCCQHSPYVSKHFV